MFRLGKIFYHGSIYNGQGGIASGGDSAGRIPRDFVRAHYYFERIARTIWPTDPADPLQHNARRDETPQQGSVGYAAAAAGYIGRMYLRGEGVRPDAKRARMWFERGIEHGEKESLNGLGIIWRDGLVDGRKDVRKAIGYFGVAAGQDLPEAQVNMGKHHYRALEGYSV
jgi:SEL1 protein